MSRHYLKGDDGGGRTRTVPIDYPSNNGKTAKKTETTERKKIEPVAKATRKKRTLGTKIRESIVGNDSQSVTEYIFQDVLIPAAKDTITTMISGGIEMLMYGEVRARSKTSSSKNGSKASYYKYYEGSGGRERDRDRGYSNRNQYSFDDVVLDSKGEAEEVLGCMEELIDLYGVATVADFYDLVGIVSDYTDNKYGWTSLRNGGSRRVNGGFILDLPKPKVVD